MALCGGVLTVEEGARGDGESVPGFRGGRYCPSSRGPGQAHRDAGEGDRHHGLEGRVPEHSRGGH